MPERLVLYNGGTKCDVLIGPCSCGAWHDLEELSERCEQVCNDKDVDFSVALCPDRLTALIQFKADEEHWIKSREFFKDILNILGLTS